MTAGPPVRLLASGVGVHYGDRHVLRDVSVRFETGRITALVGPSGCGKTSFLGTLNRLTDLTPGCRVSGSVRLDGRDVRNRGVDPRWLRRRVGMVFQQPNPFPLSVRANVELALREHGPHDRSARAERVEEALGTVGLLGELDRLDHPALSLSGGQQQRLCIARAIALRPDVLLLDEPCSALDPLATARVEQLLLALRPHGTIAIVTHNLAQARRLADHVAVFWTEDGVGTLIEQGPANEVFEAPRDPRAAAYLAGRRG